MRLKESNILITGAGSGIGRAMAVAFAMEGARVFCAGRRPDALAETVKLIEDKGGCGIACVLDITEPRGVAELVDRIALKESGGLKLLIANAGLCSAIGPTWEIDPEIWKQDLMVNAYGSMLCVSAALRRMVPADNGTVITLGTGSALGPASGISAYSSSKTALLRMVEIVAKELAHIKSKVKIYNLDPGFTRTPMTETLAQEKTYTQWSDFNIQAQFDTNQGNCPERAADFAVRLAQCEPPLLSGKMVITGDNLTELSTKVEQKKDARSLRLVWE
jgi:NAD(P)-dependent dehydrogenase (short-subunit alcohol dehydrogenase family)